MSLRKLIKVKIFLISYDSNGDMFFDSVMTLCLVIVECNPETKTGVQELQDKIDNAKSATIDNDKSKMLEYVASTMIIISYQGEIHDELMKNTSNSLLIVPNKKFHQCFNLEMMGWKGGTETCTHDELMEASKTIHNNMIT